MGVKVAERTKTITTQAEVLLPGNLKAPLICCGF